MSGLNNSDQGYFGEISIHNPATSGQYFLQGFTVVTLYKHLQHKAQNGNMDLLISAPLDLFQIDISYLYKSSTKELNIFYMCQW
jgi:hypothetical protein